ncbi:MAG: ABC transporter permease, partial [Planctomycetes bacterium]|nr:ABC transporter permease [Planctomycetota bacterium]
MEAKAMRALLWKEWREKRLLVVLAPVASILGFVVSLAQSPHYLDRACSDGLVVASLMWPVFALLIGAGMMANERDRGTHPFLLSQPIPRSRLWFAKLTAQIAVLSLGILISVG